MGNTAKDMTSRLSAKIPQDDSIIGVYCKALKTHPDERGFFREIIRSSDPFFKEAVFAQWSHSKMQKSVVKAWHYHHVQIDWWYVALGQVQVVLFDNREESPTYRGKLEFIMGDTAEYGPETLELCVKIPPGVLHGLKVLSDTAHLFYITSEIYNPSEEGRFPYNSDIVPHDWGKDALTVPNDRKSFVPTSTRVILK